MGDRKSSLIGKGPWQSTFNRPSVSCPCAMWTYALVLLMHPCWRWNASLPQLSTSVLILFLQCFLSCLGKHELSPIWIPNIHYLFHSSPLCVVIFSFVCILSATFGVSSWSAQEPGEWPGEREGTQGEWQAVAVARSCSVLVLTTLEPFITYHCAKWSICTFALQTDDFLGLGLFCFAQ